MLKLVIILILSFFTFYSYADSTCVGKDQSNPMCKGYGYCTMFNLGKDGVECGKAWSIPKDFKAMAKDCLKNPEISKIYQCKNGGKVAGVICGKSNCYVCTCD